MAVGYRPGRHSHIAIICSLVVVFSLVSVSSTYVKATNTTEFLESNFTEEVEPTSETNMSYSFKAAGQPTPSPRFNASIVDTIFQIERERWIIRENLEEMSQEYECFLRKQVEEQILDFDAPPEGRYCGSYFDTIMCWSASSPGIVQRPCPEFFNDVHYNTSLNVTRYCNLDGTWGNDNKSNYSCEPIRTPVVNGHDIALEVLVYVGYSMSFTALMGAFCVFLFFRSLRCVRNYIHWNLVSSFILLYIFYFTVSGVVGVVKDTPELLWICRLLYVLMMYIMMTNFFWMFVEGVYLYTLVVRALTVRRNRFWIYCIFGWGVPVPFVVVFSIVKKINSGGCWVSVTDNYSFIVVFPIFAVIVANLYFLIHIMAILVTKLRASHSLETQQYRKGVKGTLFLLPLLGVTYLLFLMGPAQVDDEERSTYFYVFSYFSTILSSLQGFFVAVIYVFLNQEVQNVIKRKIRRWREENTLPTRVVSRRGSNTRTSFGNLGIFGGRKTGHNSTAGETEQVSAFKLPSGNTSPEVYSNGSKVPPFIRLDEVQPLTPVSEAPTSPPTLYSSLSSGNGNDTEAQPMTAGDLDEVTEASPCNGLSESPASDSNELPLLSTPPANGGQDVAPHSELDEGVPSSKIPGKGYVQLPSDKTDVLNGNHNNNNSLSPCLVGKPKTAPSPFAGRSRVTFADELVHENHKRPVCCDTGKNPEPSPEKKVDSDRPASRGHSDGEDSPDTGMGKQDTQRSPLLPCIRKKPWASAKPNGTIAFPKAPEGTPV